MTTSAEVRQILAQYPAEAQRVVFKASALLRSEEGLDEIARDVVALANRDGGRLVLGVGAGGQLEGQLELSRQECDEAVAAMLRTRIVPVPETILEHLTGQEGELLVIKVEPRRGAPHAFARVTPRGSVGGRIYYVRDGASTRPVTDGQLAWMFRVAGDPAVRVAVPVQIHTVPGSLVPADSIPQPVVVARFGELLAGLPGDVGKALAGHPERRVRAFAELSAWAFLTEVQAALAAGDLGLETAEVAVADLPVPATGSAFGAPAPSLRELLEGGRRRPGIAGLLGRARPGRRFVVPRGAEVQVDFLDRQSKGRVTLSHPSFTVTLSTLPAGAGEGLAWPGFEGALAGGVQWTGLEAALTCSLPFPARDAATGIEGERLARRLADRLRSGWDSRRFLDCHDPAFLMRVVGDGRAP